MKKDEILEKSKDEFKNSDPYSADVRKTYLQRGMAVVLILSFVFFLTEIFVKNNLNFGLLAINFVSSAALDWAEYKLHPQKSRLVIAVIASLAVVIAAAGYIVSLCI